MANLNYLATNCLPRKTATRFIGWFSRIENPWLAALSIRVWQQFAEDLRLDEAQQQRFRSLRDCFIRELKPGTRVIDPRADTVISPCDAVIGANGRITGDQLLQVKGSPYALTHLLGQTDIEQYLGGCYVTLRLKSSMYHRFHAPADCSMNSVRFIPGEYWNVNPPTLARVPELFCRNERAVIPLEAAAGSITLVPVAAILVGSLKLHCMDQALDMNWKGPLDINCTATFARGDQMGYFQHGSTIIVLTSPDFQPVSNLIEGQVIRMGQALLQRRPHSLHENRQPSTT